MGWLGTNAKLVGVKANLGGGLELWEGTEPILTVHEMTRFLVGEKWFGRGKCRGRNQFNISSWGGQKCYSRYVCRINQSKLASFLVTNRTLKAKSSWNLALQ